MRVRQITAIDECERKSKMGHKDLRPIDLTVLVDSREKTPPPIDLAIPTKKATLQTGDYTLLGLERHVCVERKSLQDLVMCCGRERDRFRRCIERLRQFELALLVIEATPAVVEMKQYRGEIHPNVVLNSVESWRAEGINIIWAGNQVEAARQISRTLFFFAKKKFHELGAFYESLGLETPGNEKAC